MNVTSHVLRFYGNIDYALECIALKEITFIHVDKLNDPFDPVLDYFTDFDGDYGYLLKWVEENYPSQFDSFRGELSKQTLKDYLDGLLEKAKERRSNMFLFSTCAVNEEKHPRDNLYMWGHYGNGHRGIAIEFNSSSLIKLMKKENLKISEIEWWKMDYTNKLPKINCESIFEYIMSPQEDSKLFEITDKILRSKSKVWELEGEYRLVQFNNETKLKKYIYGLPDNAINAVYLGCRIPESESEEVVNDFVCETQRNFPNASVFMVKMRPGEFALDFNKISP